MKGTNYIKNQKIRRDFQNFGEIKKCFPNCFFFFEGERYKDSKKQIFYDVKYFFDRLCIPQSVLEGHYG